MAGVVTAMLLYAHRDTAITPEAVEEQWAKDWGTTPYALTNGRAKGQRMDFDCGGHSVSVLPWTEQLDLDFVKLGRISRLWPTELKLNHPERSLVMLSTNGGIDAIEAHTVLSQILASLIAVSPRDVVVFWQTAMHVIEPQEFRRMVQEGHLLPLIWLWVSIHAETTDAHGVMHVYTTGLERLGLMELEISAWKKDEQAAFQLLSNIAMYLVGNGRQIAHGETLTTAEHGEVVTAEHGQSTKHPQRQVIRLRLK